MCSIILKIFFIYLKISMLLLNAITHIIKFIYKTQCDTRTNIYIGITGILIAVVIFIAELVSEDKVEIYKNLMLKRTKIINIVRNMIITLILIWIGDVIKYDAIIFNLLLQIIIDIMIIKSTIETFKIFMEVIHLNTNKEYFNKKLYEFINDEIKENSYKKEKQIKEYKNLNLQFEDFIAKSKIFKFEKYPYFLDESYSTIESNTYGYIKSYDYFVLKNIEDNLLSKINKSNSNTEDTNGSTELPVIYICKSIGEKCNKDYPIVYYKNTEEKYINLINKAIIIEENSNVDTQISKIIDDIFIISRESISSEEDSIISNLYDNFCRNKYENIISVLLDKILNLYIKYVYDVNDNEKFSKLLTKLSMIAIRYNRYEDFKNITLYLTGLYIQKNDFEGADIKHIAYKYANNVFLLNKYALIRKKQYIYYDVMMANLFDVIKAFIRRNRFDAIFVLFDNISFDTEKYDDIREFNDLDIIYFQFTIAIIYVILYSYKREEENGKISNEHIEDILMVVNILKDKFFYFYDLWDIIIKFNKYSNKSSEITRRSRDIDLDTESHKYKNSWSWSPINKDEVLKCMVYMFDINYYNTDNIDKSLIIREDNYKYNSLKELFERKTFCSLEEKFDYESKYKKNVLELLDKIIKIEEEKELQFEKEAEIDADKIEKFKNIVVKNSKYKSKLEEYIEKIGNKKVVDEKMSVCLGINKLLPRSWFIKDDINTIYTDHLAEDLGKAFERGLKKELLLFIKENSIKKIESLEDIVKEIENIQDYVLLINREDLYELNYVYNTKEIEISNKKIKIISLFDIEDTILINKNSFPLIEICNFDDSYSKDNIVESDTYIEITDCLKNTELRNELIKQCKWIEEKGDTKEQHDYLKRTCDFKVYKAYRVIRPKEKESYIIKKLRN